MMTSRPLMVAVVPSLTEMARKNGYRPASVTFA